MDILTKIMDFKVVPPDAANAETPRKKCRDGRRVSGSAGFQPALSGILAGEKRNR
jgi:hypothetical protein